VKIKACWTVYFFVTAAAYLINYRGDVFKDPPSGNQMFPRTPSMFPSAISDNTFLTKASANLCTGPLQLLIGAFRGNRNETASSAMHGHC